MSFDNLEIIKQSGNSSQPNETTLDQIYEFYQVQNVSQESLTENITYDFSLSHQTSHIYTSSEYEQQQMHQSSLRQKYTSKISGVHEKYLNPNSYPLTKKSFQSEKKIISSVPNLIQKIEKKNSKEPLLQNAFKLHPLNQGLKGLKLDAKQFHSHIVDTFHKGQVEKDATFLQLGLKQPKALGKGRTQREIANILKFLQTGEMPQQYITIFLQSIHK